MSTVTRMMTVLAATALLSGCALSAEGEDREVSTDAEEEAAVGVGPAEPGTLETCEELTSFDFEATQIRQAELIPEGEEENAGEPVGEHCLVTGEMNERTSDADGERYAICFETCLPADWAGRYGEAPEHMEATARGEGNPGGVNEELPDDWAADRTRLLCPYPETAHYEEDAASFSCRKGSG